MKYTFIYSVLMATVLFLNACKNKQQSSESALSADTSDVSVNRVDAVESDWLAKLVGEEDGLFRGVNLGDEVSVIKEKESAEPFEEDAAHIGYTIDYPNLESTDIQFFLDKNKRVTKIEVDIYLNNRESVDSHKKELEDYFTRRYGNATQQSWKAPGNSLITLRDVSKGKDYGLKLTFSSVQPPKGNLSIR